MRRAVVLSGLAQLRTRAKLYIVQLSGPKRQQN